MIGRGSRSVAPWVAHQNRMVSVADHECAPAFGKPEHGARAVLSGKGNIRTTAREKTGVE